MSWYSYNNIIIIAANAIILEFLTAWPLDTGTPKLTILSFLTRART